MKFELSGIVGADGMLTLIVPVGTEKAGQEVVVSVEMAEAKPPMTREEWLAFIARTAGSITDPTFDIKG